MGRKSKFQQRSNQSKMAKTSFLRKRRLNWRRLLILGFFLSLVIWSFYPLKFRFEQQRELAALKHQIALLRAQNERLREDIAKLKSNEYIEQLAREKLGLAKPGEETYIVIEESLGKGDTKAINSKTSGKRARAKISFWRRVKKFMVRLLD